MNVNPSYEIKQISKKESITQIYKSGDDISKYIDYKPKYLNLKKILKTNLKDLRVVIDKALISGEQSIRPFVSDWFAKET